MSEAKAKPTGPIPPYFAVKNGELAIGGKSASELVAAAGDTPLFVYSTSALEARVGELRAAMPKQLGIHYAMKANPFSPLLGWMKDRVDGFDVASGGELQLALDAGVAADKISFAGPGKRDRELELAIAKGATLNCESEGEVERAFAIGDRLGMVPKIAVRVNPSFDLKGSGMKMGGGAKPFGVDAEGVPALVRRVISSGAEWRGFHIYAGSQALDAEAIIAMQAQTHADRSQRAGGVPFQGRRGINKAKIGPVERVREFILVAAESHGVGARLQYGQDAPRALLTQGRDRHLDCSRVVREIVVDLYAARAAAQLQPAADALERGECCDALDR